MMKRVLLVTIGLIFSLGAQAQTSCSLLSQCPNALLPLNGSEIMYIVQGGISRQVTTSNLMGVNTSILPLNNVWIGTNTFNGNVSILGPTNIFQSNISNFIQVINVSNGPDVSGALVAAVLGSSSVPNTSGNATIIGQKIGSGVFYLAAGVWGTFIDGGNTAGGVGYHGSGVEGTAQLRVAYSAEGPYFDGGTFRCEILSTSTNAECNGTSIMNVYDTVNHIFALGVECDLGNNTGVDDVVGNYQNGCYMASMENFGTSNKGGFAFGINPYSSSPFNYGFWVGAGATQVGTADIELDNTTTYGINMSNPNTHITYGIALANNLGIWAVNASNTLSSILYVDTSGRLNVGNDPSLSGNLLISNSGIPTTVQQNLTVAGNLQVLGNYQSADSTFGVTCSPGSPSASFATKNGLVVHC